MLTRSLILLLLGAAVSVGAEVRPTVTHLGTVSPRVVGITVRAQHVEYGRQVPYTPEPGDVVDTSSHHRAVTRDSTFIGHLVGHEQKLLHTPDRLVGEELDAAAADRPESYRITSAADRRYADGVTPIAVHRKSKPTDLGRTGPWKFGVPMQHVLYLVLPHPLEVGSRYTITFKDALLPELAFVYDPRELRSEAVHVSHTGFRPDDPAKVAFLSCWLGSGGGLAYAGGLKFEVLQNDTGRSVFTGTVSLAKAGDDMTEDAYGNNFNKTDVYEMDFSSLATPGTYRVSVEGVGCSYPFEIAEDAWRKAFTVSARGFYHQRSGIELGPPYTSFERPRSFHPDDGVTVYASTTALMGSGNGLNMNQDPNNFASLVRGKSDYVVPDAWGGYMDAGDWDRRIQHLKVSRLLLELAGLFPVYFGDLGLNIPESEDGLPDVVSEALFNLDCYRRMQTEAGGIRGGIESEEHPRHGEASWQESLTILAYAPGVWSSHVYAGVAARAAHLLGDHDPELAAVYRESALRAMRWAEEHFDDTQKYPHAVNDDRNLAAAELFRLTGDPEWQALFLATTAFRDPKAELYLWQDHEQRDAAWVYVRTDRAEMNAEVKRNCRAAILREADARTRRCRETGFRWTTYEWKPFSWGAATAPDAVSLVRAHVLTGDEKYLRAAVLACQTGLGANPVNVCYTTGLGHKSPEHPLHIDSRITHQTPPPGLTVGGPVDVVRNKDFWGQKLVAPHVYPDILTWPSIEAFWDVFWNPPMCEFTVQTPMAENAYVWGYLAARGGSR